eukprot:COSAG02_NODE_26574_length_630_cov_0.768362_1_plen_91_part_10
MQHCACPPVPVCDHPESPDCQPPDIETPTARIVFFVVHSAFRKSAVAETLQRSESVRHIRLCRPCHGWIYSSCARLMKFQTLVLFGLLPVE